MISSADWELDMGELKSKFTSKTKAIIYNNPNNPLGKVFTRSEITDISQLCIDNDVLMISDEVYEHMVFDENKMIRWVGWTMGKSPKLLQKRQNIPQIGKF